MAVDDLDAEVPERQPGWHGMWVAPEEDPRETSSGGTTGTDERSVLTDYLRHYRLTLQLKCSGLTAEQLARRSVPPSTMSLLGLVRHLAGVEQIWFRIRLAGQELPRHYRENSPDGEFDEAVADPAMVEEAFTTWQTEIAFADAYIAAAPDMGQVGANGDVLRDIVVHMIEEYARHCGHADLLHERIDGRVGQ